MSDTLLELSRTDDQLTAIAERRSPDDAADPVLGLLAAWAADIDAHPVAEARPAPVVAGAVPTVLRHGRRVAALTLAITVSSSGIAAAVNGDPLAPLHFVVTNLGKIGTVGGPAHEGISGARDPFDPMGVPVDDGRGGAATSRGESRPEVPASRHDAPASASDGDDSVTVARARPDHGDSSGSASPRPPRRPDPVVESDDPQTPPRHPDGGDRPLPPKPEPSPDPVPEPKPSPRPHGEPGPMPVPEEPSPTPTPPQKPGSDPPTRPE